MYWISSNGTIELNITKAQAIEGSHTGSCDIDILELSKLPKIARQLKKVDKDELVKELLEYGAWTEEDLQNHETNLQVLLWIACCDIREECNL